MVKFPFPTSSLKCVMSVAAFPSGMLGTRSRLRPLPLSLVGWCASCYNNNNNNNNNNNKKKKKKKKKKKNINNNNNNSNKNKNDDDNDNYHDNNC